MLFDKTVATLANLFGPNNPHYNFSASQINNKNGMFDTSDTLGNATQTPHGAAVLPQTDSMLLRPLSQMRLLLR